LVADSRPLAGKLPSTHSALGAERSNVSGETFSSKKPDARPFMSRGVAIYFGVLFVLTLIALIPGTITIGLLLFIGPGLTLIVSGTLLYYSIAVLPAYFIHRLFRRRLLAAAVAAVSLAAAAVLPHYIDGYLLGRLVAGDHSDPPTSFQPRSFELPYPESDNYWTNWRRPESHLRTPPPSCADLCQQLLFKGYVDQVFVGGDASQDPLASGTIVITGGRVYHITGKGNHVIRPSELSHDSSVQEIPIGRVLNPTAFFKPKWRRFRLQQREACPDTLSLIEGEFVRQVVGGRCLLEDTVDSSDADAVLSVAKSGQGDPRQNSELSRIQTGPTTVTITERRDHRTIPVEVKTTLVAHYATMPFYFSPIRCGGSNIPDLCLVVATDPFPESFADPFAMIGRRYGWAIAPTPWLAHRSVSVADDERTLVGAILQQDYGADGYIPMTPSRLVASFVNARLKSGELNGDDIELIRALLKQRAFAVSIESNLPPSTYQALKPLLPEMFERIAYRADGQSEIVQSLDVILDHFAAEDTDPYSLALCRDHNNADLRVCYKREFRNAHQN
jgi:hypothetical protein